MIMKRRRSRRRGWGVRIRERERRLKSIIVRLGILMLIIFMDLICLSNPFILAFSNHDFICYFSIFKFDFIVFLARILFIFLAI
jgi:hypothetical protein